MAHDSVGVPSPRRLPLALLVPAAVTAAVRAWSEGPLKDEISLLAIERVG